MESVMVLPEELRHRFTHLMQQLRSFGDERAEVLIRDVTLRVATQVIEDLESKLEAEKKLRTSESRGAAGRVVSARVVLPEIGH